MRLIGLVGKRGSGKSTIADNAAEAFPHVRVVAVADPIKRIVSGLYDGNLAHVLWGESEHRDFVIERSRFVGRHNVDSFRFQVGCVLDDFVHVDVSRVDGLFDMLRDMHGEFPIRNALIQVGQWGRSRDPDFWVRYWRQTVDRIFAHGLNYAGNRGLSTATEAKRPPCVVVPDVRFPREAGVIHELGGLTIRVEREVKAPRDSVDHDVTETAQDDIRADLVLKNDSDVSTVTRCVRRLIS